MIKEDYVSYEVAKLLKEKGFDEPCHYFYEYKRRLYNDMDKYFPSGMKNSDHNKEGNKGVSAPTLQMAIKWLREVHDVHIDISIYVITVDILKYNINVYYKKHKNDSMYLGIHLTKECPKYEEAVEVALKYSLENLI